MYRDGEFEAARVRHAEEGRSFMDIEAFRIAGAVLMFRCRAVPEDSLVESSNDGII